MVLHICGELKSHFSKFDLVLILSHVLFKEGGGREGGRGEERREESSRPPDPHSYS